MSQCQVGYFWYYPRKSVNIPHGHPNTGQLRNDIIGPIRLGSTMSPIIESRFGYHLFRSLKMYLGDKRFYKVKIAV